MLFSALLRPMLLHSYSRSRRHRIHLEHFLPGIVLVSVVTAAAFGVRQLPGLSGLSPMFSAMLIGLVFANFTPVPQQALPGVGLMGKKMLRFAVALFGLQLTATQVGEIGVPGMLAICGLVASTYCFTVRLGAWMKVDGTLTRLLAAGTAICGASAIAAANAVENGRDEDVSYAIACVTLFGTLAVALYPTLGQLVGLDVFDFAFWSGATIHEVAQVVAAGFQWGQEAGEMAVVVKLSRVLLLAPLVILLGTLARRSVQGTEKAGDTPLIPLFVVGFICFMLANTFGAVPGALRQPLIDITPILLTASLAALGLGTKFAALKTRGFGPFLLAGAASAFIATAGLVLLPIL